MNLQYKNRLVLWNLPPQAVVKWYKTDLDWYKTDSPGMGNRGTKPYLQPGNLETLMGSTPS